MIGEFFLLTTLALAQGKAVGRPAGFVASDRCPAAGHQLLPHEYDCTKFYSCDNGRKWETPRVCRPGTEFSYELQICGHPDQTNCNLHGAPPPDAEELTGALQAPVPTDSTAQLQIHLDWPQNDNSAYKNIGIFNIGFNNTGVNNTGDNNEGDNNRGNNNTGNNNRGDNNPGNYNIGNGNRGNYNRGDNNIGHNNTGDSNTGNNNIGDSNSGNNNTGNNNTGDNHIGDNQSGYSDILENGGLVLFPHETDY